MFAFLIEEMNASQALCDWLLCMHARYPTDTALCLDYQDGISLPSVWPIPFETHPQWPQLLASLNSYAISATCKPTGFLDRCNIFLQYWMGSNHYSLTEKELTLLILYRIWRIYKFPETTLQALFSLVLQGETALRLETIHPIETIRPIPPQVRLDDSQSQISSISPDDITSSTTGTGTASSKSSAREPTLLVEEAKKPETKKLPEKSRIHHGKTAQAQARRYRLARTIPRPKRKAAPIPSEVSFRIRRESHVSSLTLCKS
jgi:hypothetical protein